MHRVKLAAAACALLLTAACGAGPYSDAAQRVDPLTSQSSSAAAKATAAPSARPANQRLLGTGLTLTVSAPRSFTPTDAAYPHTPRAIAFELIIDNLATTAYRPSELSITATCNGASALQVVDSTQGYTGHVGTTEEVPPGANIRVTVAFAVPAERAEVVLMVQPDAADGGRITVFEGTV